MGNRKKWKALYVSLLAACILCLAFLIFYLYQKHQKEQQAEEIYDELTVEVIEPAEQEYPEQIEEEPAELPVDFEELWEINPEIYAWIRIPDTNVDYPILQREGDDQSYYLEHNMYGEVQTAASIYTETYNSKDFQDPNTLIYGHNMKNGSMFHDLRYFAEQEYFDEHKDLYIYMPGKVLRYEIFASYEYDDRHLMLSFDFSDPEVFAEYIEEITNPRSMSAMVREGCEITADDKIVTLSTCIANKPNNRRLVQAVLREELDAEYRGAAEEAGEEQQEE